MRSRNQQGFLAAASVLALGVMSMAGPAFAADAEDAPAAAPDGGGVGEITVTATRRAERLQSVPLAVTAISGQDFEKTGLRGPGDLQFLSPSVQLSIVGGNGIYLRGAGINSQNAGTEQSVGMVIDGVVIGFVDDIGGDLTDAERIEVLRGPQGTQFGKNASAGVISITTRAPQFDKYSLNAHASFGEHRDSNNSLKVNIPITSNLATRMSLFYQNRDGVFPDVVRNNKQGDVSQWGGRIKVLWQPSDALTVTLTGDYRDEKRQPNFIQSYRNAGTGYTVNGVRYGVPGLGNLQAGIVPSATNVEIGEAQPADRRTRTGGGAAQLDYDLGGFTLTSLTAFRRMDRLYHSPYGSGVQPALYGTTSYIGNQVSQEFRLTSPAGKKLTYIAGLYYYNRATHGGALSVGDLYGLATATYGAGAQIAANGGRIDTTNDNTSYAAFLDGSYALTSHLKVLGGVRYTDDKVGASANTVALPGVYVQPGTTVKPSDSASFSNDAISWRGGLQYTFTPDVMLYATAARGYKGPVADTSTAVIGRVKPEYVRSYEVGLKSSWFDRKLLFNVTLFDQKFTDFQTTVLNTTVLPFGFVLGNAGGEKTRGVELETQVAPVANLHLSGGVTYLDAKFTDFRASCYSSAAPIPMPTTTNADGTGGCYTIPGTTTRFTQAAGSPLNNASKWSYKLSADYKVNIGQNYAFDASTTWVWRSNFRTNGYDPNTVVPGYGTLALNAGIGAADGRWRLGFFARNLLNKYFISAIQSNSYDNGGYTNVLNIEAVRTVGAAFDFKM